jgi:hypothetical protein
MQTVAGMSESNRHQNRHLKSLDTVTVRGGLECAALTKAGDATNYNVNCRGLS